MSPVASGPDDAPSELVGRVRAGKPLIGTFVKTTSHQTVELLGHSGLDFVILDAEHAPFGVEALDRSLAVAPAVNLPALVRVPSHDPAFINACLDMDASGVVAPHVRSADDVETLLDAVKYSRGKRGFSPSARSGRFGGLGIAPFRELADRQSMLWCQIEDSEALDNLDAIAAIDGVDCLFIGPVDLAMSLGCQAGDPELQDAIRAIAEAGKRHGRNVGLFVPNTQAIPPMMELGISTFLCGTDQGLLLTATKKIAADAFSSIG